MQLARPRYIHGSILKDGSCPSQQAHSSQPGNPNRGVLPVCTSRTNSPVGAVVRLVASAGDLAVGLALAEGLVEASEG